MTRSTCSESLHKIGFPLLPLHWEVKGALQTQDQPLHLRLCSDTRPSSLLSHLSPPLFYLWDVLLELLLLLLFSHPVMSNCLQPHGSQHTRRPCPSPSLGVRPSSRSLYQWCHPAISSSDTLFSFCPQSSVRNFSNESTVHIRWPKYWSFSFSISPSNEYSGFISFKINWLTNTKPYFWDHNETFSLKSYACLNWVQIQ